MVVSANDPPADVGGDHKNVACVDPAASHGGDKKEGGCGADWVVHMLWIGEGSIPDFAAQCITSFPATGHCVHLWVYPQQQPDVSLLPQGVMPRDANEIIPLETALAIGYYYGMGRDLKFASWSTFSDLFRYELLFKEGGWWCDADSIAVRNLVDADFPRGGHVFATERWRPGGYRNIILSVPIPGTPGAGTSPEYINDVEKEEAKEWREAQNDKQVHCCVLTNSHIRAPPGSELMRACADKLRPLMERYGAQRLEHTLGDESVDWALPCGGEGLRIYQEEIAARIEGGPLAEEFLAAVQHYAVFNPVEIDDFPGGLRVLKGERVLPEATCAVHFFGIIRSNWKMLGLQLPTSVTEGIVRDKDNAQLLTEIKKVEGRAKREANEERRRKRREEAE